MSTSIRSGLMRCSGSVFTGAALMLVTLLSWSSPTTVDSQLATASAASVASNTIREDYNKQISQPRWIEIDLSEQRLRAWEGKKLVYSFRTSTGKRSTPTPLGRFTINSKYRTHRMRGRGYDIPDVPYAMYFYGGYAIHGAYWHNRFGTPVSHGCVNLPVRQARKIYNWTRVGTKVVVRR
ncbi:ErfK/YbiS/YcfS/YnhG family protein [Richelia sinica FACHB-800]|uniref:ErfK/YbiS/YcfS/YnhG family protein n=1 Tax=Richelia sinica FACHB-800 TaxID=1357546 RepID=A0A975TBX2_9NOST|nr:L,D-transpeptidase [Richelia sinica]MBD2664593.1 L,D-transpeptidase [Richelia sinica FACHB-800]QXE25217.1 ErfK/YbiS/YcfS/YnhG family protein [Richelia sinica FACHB-800]